MIKKIFFFLFFCQSVLAQNFDINLLKNINVGRNQSWDIYAKDFSNSTAYISLATPFAMLSYGAIKHDIYWKRQGVNALAATALCYGSTMILKKIVNRERPYDKYSFIQNLAVENSKSFPSGHTSLAFANATSLALATKKWYVILPATAYACGVGYSRLHMGVHYPTDVMAGALLGTGSAFVSHFLNKKLINYYRSKKAKN